MSSFASELPDIPSPESGSEPAAYGIDLRESAITAHLGGDATQGIWLMQMGLLGTV
jgi:hypothetical protein